MALALLSAEREYYKDEIIHLLTRPMEEVAHLFQRAFLVENHQTRRISLDWAKATIVIEFEGRQPTSDLIRNTIFSMYQKKWGGKPAGIEVAYNRAIEYKGANDWGFAPIKSDYRQQLPIRLFITSSGKALADLINGKEKAFVLDDKEFHDWHASWAHNALKRAALAKPDNSPPLVSIGPGDQVPVVRVGLFKV